MKTITLGILGGGQLGRMSALAAARLGISVHIFTDENDAPASQVCAHSMVDDYSNQSALKVFADAVDVISYEFENIPVDTVRYLQKIKPVYPDDRLLEIAQDRRNEKSYLNDLGIQTARWMAVEKADDVEKFLQDCKSGSCIIKTARFGYDGKGQKRIDLHDDVSALFKDFAGAPLIVEESVDFVAEISVIVARDRFGGMAFYGPVMNEHRNHILYKTIAPAPITMGQADKAVEMARRLADAVQLIGVLGLELFVGKDGNLLANEIAPRTHNSGHWSIDACAISQFENHVRTVCGLPVGAPGRHSDAEMTNLIGKDALRMQEFLSTQSACVHLYGKRDIREGRKLGHITRLKPLSTLKT